MEKNMNLQQPVFFRENRVRRVYLGGRLLGQFVGAPCEDDFFPEEWIASTVEALNKDSVNPREGLSIVEGTDISLKELLEKYPKETLGERKELGVLVKFLDSAIRLPVQVHPDKAFSMKYFNSRFGKAEMWLVLATRENAAIHFGFKEKITKEELLEAIENSYQNKEEMIKLVNTYPVKAGDVFFIPGKLVHAIGKGCLILEIQEPTDFTIQPEYWCGDYEMNEQERYIGLSKEAAAECFDYEMYGADCEKLVRKTPILLWEKDGVKKEAVITEKDTACFGVNRCRIHHGKYTLEAAPAVYVAVKGGGRLQGQDYSRPIKQGDYFFLPHQASGKVEAVSEQGLELVECLPPKSL